MSFNVNELRLCDMQYKMRHINVNNFNEGEKVFLKSNPEHEMTVFNINKGTITVISENDEGEISLIEFPPECILQYRFAGLMVWKNLYELCLN